MKITLPQTVSKRTGFSLIETLVVVSIIVLILALTAPTMFQTMRANKLSTAGDSILGTITEAQQLAVSLNSPVEMRFFLYSTPLSPFTSYRAFQLFKISTPDDMIDSGTGGTAGNFSEMVSPLTGNTKISGGVVISSDSVLSPLLNGATNPDSTEAMPNGYSGISAAQYFAIRFMPDGTCRRVLAISQNSNDIADTDFKTLNMSYFTLTDDIGAQVTMENLPNNFYTIQIDPFNSKTRTYRPGQN